MKRNFMISVSLLTLLCSCSNSVSSTTTNEELPISNILSQSEDTNDSSIDNNRTYPESGDLICEIECPAPKSIDDQFKFNVYCAHSWRTEEGDLSYYPADIKNWTFKIILYYEKTKLKKDGQKETIEKGSSVIAEIPDFLSAKYDVSWEYYNNPTDTGITLKEAIEVEVDSNIFTISDDEYGLISFWILPFDSNNEMISRDIASMASTDDRLWFLNDSEKVAFYNIYPSNIINGRQATSSYFFIFKQSSKSVFQ